MPGSGVESYAWVGFAVIVAQAAAIVAAGLAADGLRPYIESGVLRLAAAAGCRGRVSSRSLTPVAACALVGRSSRRTVSSSAPPTRRCRPTSSTRSKSDAQQRILVINGDESEVDYEVLADDGLRLGDDSVSPQLGIAGARCRGRRRAVGEPCHGRADAGRLRHRLRDDAEPGRLRVWSPRSTDCRV